MDVDDNMGITAMIPDMSLDQLIIDAPKNWAEIWDSNAARTRVMLICPRKERKIMELHGDFIEHGQPVMGVFHRPRVEEDLLREQGFDPRSASFQFLDISTPDLGPWLQDLIKNDGWVRSTIQISPLPFNIDSPAQRQFEKENILCFKHPSLGDLATYYLPFPIGSIPGKCFISLPRKQAAEMARQQAEILGVGRLPTKQEVEEIRNQDDEKIPIVEDEPKPMVEAIQIEPVPLPSDANLEKSNTVAEDIIDTVNQRVEQAMTDLSSQSEELEQNIDLTPNESAVPLPLNDSQNEQLPEVEQEVMAEDVSISEVSDVEREFRALIAELIEAGVEPSAMMEDARFEVLNERAIAEGFETWPVFVEMTQ